MFQVNIKSSFTKILASELDTEFANNVRHEFADRGGKILIDACREILGTDLAYTLSERYKKIKPRLYNYQHVPGKPQDQPLILSGEHIYNALRSEPTDTGFRVFIPDELARSDEGYDIALRWMNEGMIFIKAMYLVKDDLERCLERLIYEKLGLTNVS